MQLVDTAFLHQLYQSVNELSSCFTTEAASNIMDTVSLSSHDWHCVISQVRSSIQHNKPVPKVDESALGIDPAEHAVSAILQCMDLWPSPPFTALQSCFLSLVWTLQPSSHAVNNLTEVILNKIAASEPKDSVQIVADMNSFYIADPKSLHD